MELQTRTGALDAQGLEDVLTEIARQIVEHGLESVGSMGQWGCSTVCVEVCPEGVQEVLQAGACRVGVAWRDAPSLLSLIHI